MAYDTLLSTINNYLENVLDGLKSDPVLSSHTVRRVQLQDVPSEAGYAFVVTADTGISYASILVFSDVIDHTTRDNIPPTVYARIAQQSLITLVPECHIVMFYVITEDDVELAPSKMVASIVKDLMPRVYPQTGRTQIAVFVSSNEYVVDTDVEKVRHVERMRSPHAIAPRIDYGFVLQMRRLSHAKYNTDQVSVPIVAVGAFTDFIGPVLDPNDGTMKYQPIVRISSISSLYPAIGSILLGLTVAEDLFLKKAGWTQPYKQFTKGSPNLGNFHDVEDSSDLYHITDSTVMDRFVLTRMHSPILALDVTMGRDRIPEMFLFGEQSKGYNTIIGRACQFFETTAPKFSGSAFSTLGVGYTGIYEQNDGKKSDTRDFTYLETVAKMGAIDESVKYALTNYSMDPSARTSVVQAFASASKLFYETATVAISTEFLAWIGSSVADSGLRLIDPNTSSISPAKTSFGDDQIFS